MFCSRRRNILKIIFFFAWIRKRHSVQLSSTVASSNHQKVPLIVPKIWKFQVFEEFRVVRDGDFVPDAPFRVSQTIETAHHNSFEIFYGSHMAVDNYKICNQPETEYCLKGSWWKKPVAHMYLFDQTFYNYHLGYCE